MIATINPTHPLSPIVSAAFKVESQVNLIMESFFRWQRLAVLISSDRRQRKQRGYNQNERAFTTEDTEAQRTQRKSPCSSVFSVVKVNVH